MALLTLADAKTFAGITTTDPVRDASLQVIIDEAIDAVKRFCQNGELIATEYTIILDAPPYNSLVLPFAPVSFVGFQLWFNYAAQGDPTKFGSEFLLTMYKDYMLDPSNRDITTSESGIVRYLYGVWGYAYQRLPYTLTASLIPCVGSIKVVYTAGYDTVPPALSGALNLIVRKIYNMRKLGVPMTNESLNGYSYGSQNSASADGVIQGDPTIRGMLKTFTRAQVGGYY